MDQAQFQVLVQVREPRSLHETEPPSITPPPGVHDLHLLSRPRVVQPPGPEEVQAVDSWSFTATAESVRAVELLLQQLEKTFGTRHEAEVLLEDPPFTPRFYGDDPSWSQDYLGGSGQRGIDLEAIRQERGGWGEHARVLVIESGWSGGHEDLPGVVEFEWKRSSARLEVGPVERKHGNAILGILCGQKNGRGVVGLVPEAAVELGLNRPGSRRQGVSTSTLPELVGDAIARVGAGDVVVLAVQGIKWRWRNGEWRHTNPLALEAWSVIREQFREAARRNVHVVCAAGNGLGSRLEDFCRGDNYPSEALVVGASSSRMDQRLAFSNLGQRVDFHAWGEKVATCTESAYTANFNGTSSATAIVAGVVAVLSSHVKAATGRIVTPRQMRGLLARTGTRPIEGIGVQPNVARALARLKQVNYELERL